MKGSNRTYIDKKNVKVIAIKESNHREIDFDYRTMQKYNELGYDVYATNSEGVFFFLNNRNEDGMDWCKITKSEPYL